MTDVLFLLVAIGAGCRAHGASSELGQSTNVCTKPIRVVAETCELAGGLFSEHQSLELDTPFAASTAVAVDVMGHGGSISGVLTHLNQRRIECAFSCVNVPSKAPDVDGDGQPIGVDCDDNDPKIYKGAPEECGSVDSDCDGVRCETAIIR